MPNDVQTNKQKLENLLNTQERIVGDLSAYDSNKQQNAAFMEQGNIESTKEEIKLIDLFMTGEYAEEDMQLNEQDRVRLTEDKKRALMNRKALDQTHLLLNEKTKSDSPEMAAVKLDILNLSKVIEECKNLPLTQDNMDKVEVAMRMATNSCKYYVENKNPTFKTGKKRKKLVNDLWGSLLYEAELFAKSRVYLLPAHDADRPATIGDLMGLKHDDENTIKRPKTKEEEKQGNRAPQEKQPVLSSTGKQIEEYFKDGKSLADTLKAMYPKKSDRDKKLPQLKKFISDLNTFGKNSVEIMDLNFLGKNVKILQKSNNSLYLIENHKEFRLDINVSQFSSRYEMETFSSPEVFGDAEASRLLDNYSNPDHISNQSAGEHNRVRTMLSEFLGNKTGLVINEFNNTFKEKLIEYTRDLLAGTKTADEIKNEVIANSNESVYVNGVSLSEMIKLNEKSIDECRSMVVMNREEAVPEDPRWSEQELQVKNMIADLIYTNDTEKMDVSIGSPEIFMQEMVDRHKGALEAMLSSEDQDFVKSVLDKMALSNLTRETENGPKELANVLTTTLNRLKDLYRGSENGKINKEDLKTIKRELDEAVEETVRIMQNNVTEVTEAIFPEKKQATEEERRHMSLLAELKEVTNSDKGQGKFMRNTFKTYFGNVSNIDKRAMLSAVFRYSKIVDDINETDEQIIAEIQKAKIEKYKDNFKTKEKDPQTRKEFYVLSEQDKTAIAEYRQYKKTLRVQSNFMGGLIRGAGPLMQKMMQGLPVSSMPKEIQEALADTKSNLLPIPEKVVQAEFISLVQSSGGRLTKIEKIKSLGAASVAQTFLCKVYGPEMKNGKEVVIKLLRPDVKNRMQREETVMLNAARETDEAMYLTYKGQLTNYKKELDLKIESDNCKAGVKQYEGKFNNVKSMKVVEGVPATSTSFIAEKAEGVTLNKYLDELANYKKDTLKDLVVEAGSGEKFIPFKPDDEYVNKLAERKDLLLNKIDEAIRRRDHLTKLCNLWIDQAVMKQDSGFFHGDLHSGNIMINDNEATFIDFGNVMQLNKEQQSQIAKLILTSNVSVQSNVTNDSVDLFFNAFNKLIEENKDQEFLRMYDDEKKAQLKAAFAETLKKGRKEEATRRVVLCLAKAQELGIKIPPAIQNFSQGQMRLQNSIDEMNRSIEDIKKGIQMLEDAEAQGQGYDCIRVLKNRAKTDADGTTGEKIKRYLSNIMPVDEISFKQELMDNTFEYADLEIGKKEVNKRKDFRQKYTADFEKLSDIEPEDMAKLGINRDLLIRAKFKMDKVGTFQTPREQARAFFDKYKTKEEAMKKAFGVAGEIVPMTAYMDGQLDAFGGKHFFLYELANALQSLDWDRVENVLDVLENQIPKALNLLLDTNELWEKQSENTLTDAERDESVNRIYQNYNELHEFNVKKDALVTNLSGSLDFPHVEDSMKKDMQHMFEEQTDGLGESLRTSFEAYYTLKKKHPVIKDEKGSEFWMMGDEDKDAYKQAKTNLIDLYLKVSQIQVKRFSDKMFAKEANVKYVDYGDVMGDLVLQNFPMNSKFAIVASTVKLTKFVGFDMVNLMRRAMSDDDDE